MEKGVEFSKAKALEICSSERCEIKEVPENSIFTFPEGILGFEDVHKYAFILNEKVAPFMFMQAIDRPNLSFVCIESFRICPDYNIVLPDTTVKGLEIKDANDALVISLVTVRKDVMETTANLMSPIIMNMKTLKAQQVILENSNYPVRYRVWDSIEKATTDYNVVG
jgi:flagellar assembly factor FliW